MKKSMLVPFLLVVAVLLGLTVYATFLVFGGGGSLQQPGFAVPETQQNQQLEQFPVGGRMGPGMMFPGGGGRMGPGSMMGQRGIFVDSEYDFLVHMIPHHEEAVATAALLRDNTQREEMEFFAEDIIRTQSEEIEQMSTWLATWYPDREHEVDYQPMMRNLENLSAEELDRIFLEDMINHHMEAVMMSQQLLARDLAEHEEVDLLARNIGRTQRAEIHMMSSWLSQWYGGAATARTPMAGAPLTWTGERATMMWIGVIALVILIVLAVWLLKVAFSGPTSSSKVASVKSARESLDTRYAKGEISREEYLDARKNLS